MMVGHGSFHVSRTGVANVNNFIGYSMLSVCGTSINTMNVVNAAADGVFLNDPETHFEKGGIE
jgi:hypothetical protein